MAETKSKAQSQESSIRKVEENLGSRIEMLDESFRKSMAENMQMMNAKLDKKVAEIFDAMHLISNAVTKDFQTRNEEANTSIVINGEPARGRANSQLGYSGLAKLDFPRFNGDGVREWLFKVEQFFTIDNTPEDLKVCIASFHFDGLASTWHRSLVQSELLRNEWDNYRQLIEERFEDLMDDPFAQFKSLQETDGIVDYQCKFELIMTRIKWPEEYLVSAYLAGLRNDTQMHLRMFQPQSIQQCFFLGRLYEMAHPKKPSTNSWSKFTKEAHTDKRPGETLYQKDITAAPKPVVRKRLTLKEVSKRRSQGLCELCDEKFTPEHYGKHKNTQMYYTTVVEEEDNVV